MDKIHKQLLSELELSALERLAIEEIFPEQVRYNTPDGPRGLAKLTTAKGYWTIHSNGEKNFCAVYWRKVKGVDTPRTLLTGDGHDYQNLEQTLQGLTKGILEGKLRYRIFSPSRLVLYESLFISGLFWTGMTLTRMRNEIMPLASALVTAGLGALALTGIVVMNTKEKITLPESAKGYYFGPDAIKFIKEFRRELPGGSKLSELYNKLREAGVPISREEFLSLHGGMKSTGSKIQGLADAYGIENALKIAQIYSGGIVSPTALDDTRRR